MSLQSPLKFGPDTDETLFDLFKSLFLLLLAVGLLRTANSETVLTVSYEIRPIPDPTRLGTLVYAGVGLVVLGIGVALRRQRRPPELRFSRGDFIKLTGVTAVVLVGVAYGLHRSADLPAFPRELLIAVANGVVVMGLDAIGYARHRGVDIPLSPPESTHWALSLTTVILSALVGLGGTYLYMRTAGTIPEMPFDRAAMSGVWPVELLLYSVFIGLGFGLLFNGAIQTALRERLGGASAVTATAALTGVPLFVGATLTRSGGELGTLSLVALLTVENFMLVVIAFAFVQGTWVLSQRVGVALTPVRGGAAVVLVTALFSPVVWEPPIAALAVSWVVAAALGTLAFERTRSVWVPVTAYASFELFAAIETVQFLLGGYL
jgi:hypothetical protein